MLTFNGEGQPSSLQHFVRLWHLEVRQPLSQCLLRFAEAKLAKRRAQHEMALSYICHPGDETAYENPVAGFH